MDKHVVIAIVLGALVLIAGVQAFQLFTLKNKIAEGRLGSAVPTQSGASSNPQLPNNLQNLPSMVGGC